MSLRTFVDSAGNEWQAFDVVPRPDERRHYDRRSALIEAAEEAEAEERRDADRRLTVGRRSPLATGVSEGWLCFERSEGSDVQLRRLSPIPDDWRQCTEAELDAYCRMARPVRLRPLGVETSAEHHD